MSEIATITELSTSLNDKLDKISDLVEKVAVVIVKQEASEKTVSELKNDIGEIKKEVYEIKITTAKEIAEIKLLAAVSQESAKNQEKQSKKTDDAISAAIKWAAGIASALIIAGTIGAIAAL